MTKIRFELEIDSSKASQTDALNALLKAIGGQEGAESPAPMVVAEKKPTKKRLTKAEIEADKAAKEETVEETGIKLTDVRELLGEKIQSGGDEVRDQCATKLKELGAKNVSTLDPSNYEAFIDFLKTI